MKKFNEVIESNITFDSKKTIESMEGGQNTKEAFRDIVFDNSIDAKAKNILLYAENWPEPNSKPEKIYAMDDASGMDKRLLEDCLNGTSNSQKGIYDLGCFGKGVIQAGASICFELTYISTKNFKDFWTGVANLETAKKIVYKSSSEEIALFHKNKEKLEVLAKEEGRTAFTNNSGTLIVFNKIKKLTNSSERNFLQDLKEHLQNSYLLSTIPPINSVSISTPDLKIFLNEKRKIDFSENPFKDSTIKFERDWDYVLPEEIKLHGKTYPKGTICTFKVFCLIVDKGATTAKSGMYFFRNGGLLQSGGLPLLKGYINAHATYNRLRFVICFNGSCDACATQNVKKNNLDFSDSFVESFGSRFAKEVRDILGELAIPPNEIPDSVKESLKDTEKELNKHKEIFNFIIAPLKKPTKELTQIATFDEENSTRTTFIPGTKIATGRGGKHEPGLTRRRRVKNLEESDFVKFEFRSLSDDLFFEPVLEEKILTVYLNLNHPFYKYFEGLNKKERNYKLTDICINAAVPLIKSKIKGIITEENLYAQLREINITTTQFYLRKEIYVDSTPAEMPKV